MAINQEANESSKAFDRAVLRTKDTYQTVWMNFNGRIETAITAKGQIWAEAIESLLRATKRKAPPSCRPVIISDSTGKVVQS